MLAQLALAALLVSVQAADVDGDGVVEKLQTRPVTCFGARGDHAPPCRRDETADVVAELSDPCGPGGSEVRTPLLAEPHESGVSIELVEADGNAGTREALVSGFSGATARNGEIRVVRFAADPATHCATVQTLFDTDQRRFRTHRPRGAAYAATGDVRLRHGTLRLTQPWYRRSDGGCCPSYLATATFRYDPAAQVYVYVRQSVRRLR